MRRRSSTDPGQATLRRRRWALRRAVSAVLVAAAAAVVLVTLTRPAPTGVPVLVAARDLAPGSVVTRDDVTLASRSRDQLPAGTMPSSDDAVDRVLAAGVRAGEVLTDVRLVGPHLVDTLAGGQVAAPVRVADPAAAALVGPGDRVDVLVAVEGTGSARTVVRSATVLARPELGGGGGLLGDTADDGHGGLLVLGVGSSDAEALAGASAQGPLSLALRPD